MKEIKKFWGYRKDDTRNIFFPYHRCPRTTARKKDGDKPWVPLRRMTKGRYDCSFFGDKCPQTVPEDVRALFELQRIRR